ncbi:hypothetical protein ACFPES_13755 [Paenibacillus sp. GCM10023248]|uniref:hypothetical protein n=1 Tax=Bacillales TaxID=1385 RepID=UPI0023794104|nr:MULTISPECIES: hypothetical protein [Bacillales]MDD9268099.1 hypothetical protein [Paenibacillus sp. MAHUQ-63]MDR6879775.1 hypothetical protein [Bacillus sp. 3255]
MDTIKTEACSYCEDSASFRIGNADYELHACELHEDTAYCEFDLVIGESAWRIISLASHGFPERASL